MRRKRKTEKTDFSCEDRPEAESNMKAPSIVHMETAREESAGTLLEHILSRTNMAEVYKRVVKNHGSSGIDKMTVEAMYAHLKEHYAELVRSISKGNHKPEPVSRPLADHRRAPQGGNLTSCTATLKVFFFYKRKLVRACA